MNKKHTEAAKRLLAIHQKVGPASEPELSEALEDVGTRGASFVVVATMVVGTISQTPGGGDEARNEYALTRTA
jgi:hypothetical protein